MVTPDSALDLVEVKTASLIEIAPDGSPTDTVNGGYRRCS